MNEGLSYDDILLRPNRGVLKSRKDADISGILVPGIRLKIPIISANMPAVTNSRIAWEMGKAGGIGALHRFNSIEDAVIEYRQCRAYPKTIVSLGYHDGIERARAHIPYGAYIFCLDVAHGDHNLTYDFVEKFRKEFGNSFKLIVGNIATKGAAWSLYEAGVDAVKVGIGPGAACTTREVTGFGVPQFSAILEVYNSVGGYIPIIADGGIKNSGDIVKALVAGADTVMVGRLLAGCEGSPDGPVYYGSASRMVNGHRAPEGISGPVEPAGSVEDVLKTLAWGIRSGVSYAGCDRADQMRDYVDWIRVSPLTAIESSARV